MGNPGRLSELVDKVYAIADQHNSIAKHLASNHFEESVETRRHVDEQLQDIAAQYHSVAKELADFGELDWANRVLKEVLKVNEYFGALENTLQSLQSCKPPRLLFVHLPKTGGSSFQSAFPSMCETLGHRIMRDNATEMNDKDYCKTHFENWSVELRALPPSIKVTNVRNIFSFLVSYFHDVLRFWSSPSHVEDYVSANKGFAYFVNHLANKTETWVSRDLVFFQLFCQPSGRLVVDWVNRLETIEDDVRALRQYLGLSVDETARVAHKNQHVHVDYRTFYTDALADLVEQTWQDDFSLYGFDFDTPYRDQGDFVHRSTDQAKQRWAYSLNTRKVLALS